MAILKFRAFYDDDDSIYRDISIKHTQTFLDLHFAILSAYDFDNKHQATFFRSNDQWQQGREISLDVYDRQYVMAPLIMGETTLASEVKATDQKFLYLYDFKKNWKFRLMMFGVSKETITKTVYPSITRKEGIGPPQYGIRSLLGEKFADIEEKFDIKEIGEGFSESSSPNE